MKSFLLLLATVASAWAADISNFKSISVTQTNYANEVNITNGATLGGVRKTAWPAGATAGTVVSTGTPVDGALMIYNGTSGTNAKPAGITTGSSTNLTVPGKLTVSGGTETTSNPVLDISQTWNNAGTAFTGIKANFTSTASAAGSLPVDIQVDSVTKFSVNKAGRATSPEYFSATSGFYGNNNASTLSFGAAQDVFIGRDGAGIIQFGNDAATPVAQTLKAHDGNGTDKSGATLNLAGGKPTGTAAGGPLILQTGNSGGASGSSQGSYSERFHAIPKWVTLTESSATTLFTIPVPATNYVGLTATVTIYATDGTDFQSLTSSIRVDAVAKTTTITPQATQTDNTAAVSAGTLTCTYTAADNGSNVLAVKANAVSSLTQTVLRAKIVVTAINSNGTAAITEQ